MYYSHVSSGYLIYYIAVFALLILSLVVTSVLNSTYRKYSQKRVQSGVTVLQCVNRMFMANQVEGVNFSYTPQQLGDYFDPRSNTICLSSQAESDCSIAAIGVACHEAGHAIQHAKNYLPIKIRQVMIPISAFGSRFSIFMIIIGLLLSRFATGFRYLAIAGLALFALALFVQLITLPVEFNASRRAVVALQEGNMLTDDEMTGVKKILTLAALTYVIGFASSILNFLYLFSLIGGGRRR